MNLESRNNGHDDATVRDPALDRFADSLRSRLPRLPDAAMQRVERTVVAELNRAYPPAPLPMGDWPRWVAVAAMFVVTLGLAWHVSTGPTPSSRPPVAVGVTDEFQVVIEIEPRGLTGGGEESGRTVSAWDSLFKSIDHYASLIGIERLTRR